MLSPVLDIFAHPQDAMDELTRRQRDPHLREQVEAFLGGDLPAYLRNGPVLCLAQNLFTPNFEIIRFLRLIQHLGLPVVVTFDSKGLFVTQNSTKRALGKLPVCVRVTQKKATLHESYHYLTVVDFNASDGKRFSDITTTWGEPLVDFHCWLAERSGLSLKEAYDDAAWIDRHGRGDLLGHYVQFLSLFLVHGILFENYVLEDEEEAEFVRSVLRPARAIVEEKFGHAPLICELSPTSSFESAEFWSSYPAPIREFVRARAHERGDTL